MFSNTKIVSAVVAALFCLVAVFVEASAAEGNYTPLAFLIFMTVTVIVVVRPDYPLYLAIAFLCPFYVPGVPIFRLPLLPLILGLCVGSVIVHRCIDRKTGGHDLRSSDFLMVIFFFYVGLRYAVAPVLPGYALGRSMDLSGFRAWFDFGMSAITVFFLGRLVRTRQEVLRLTRYLAIVSFIFAALFLCLIPIHSSSLAYTMNLLGVFVTHFENGWNRFVVLPLFGIFLTAAAILPDVFPLPRFLRRLSLPLGILAVMGGANRSSVLSFLLLIATVFVMRKQWRAVAIMVTAVIVTIAAVNLAFERRYISAGDPAMRIFGLFNKRIDQESGGDATMEWRMARWNLAWNDIKKNPYFGVGYGGLKDYISLYSRYRPDLPNYLAEIDVASGAVHNGYISGARGLGVPAAILFVVILLRQIISNLVSAWRIRDKSSVGFQLLVYTVAMLLTQAQILFTSLELQSPSLWFIIAFAIIVQKLSTEGTASSHSQSVQSGTMVTTPAILTMSRSRQA